MDVISSKSDIKMPRFQKRDYPAEEIDQLEEARRIYGPHVCYLTRHVLEQWALTAELPIKFIGLSGQSMYSPETSAERKKELTVFKCVRVPEFEDDVDAPIIVDKRGVDWNANADYTDQEVMVTGSGDDPMFYFNRHAVIVHDDVPAPAPVVVPAPVKVAPPMNFMQGLAQAVQNTVQMQNAAPKKVAKKGASRGKKAKISKGKCKGSQGKSKGSSKGKPKGKSKGSKKFKSSTNETKAELVAILKRRKWSSKLLAGMTIHQMRVAAHVDRTWGVRNRKSTNETKAELRTFLKGRKFTNAQLHGKDLPALRKMANKIRMK